MRNQPTQAERLTIDVTVASQQRHTFIDVGGAAILRMSMGMGADFIMLRSTTQTAQIRWGNRGVSTCLVSILAAGIRTAAFMLREACGGCWCCRCGASFSSKSDTLSGSDFIWDISG